MPCLASECMLCPAQIYLNVHLFQQYCLVSPHKNIPLKKGETLKLTASRLLVLHGKEGESKGFTDCKVQ